MTVQTFYPASVVTTPDPALTAWTTTGNLSGVDFDQVKTVTPLSSISVNLSGSTSSKDANPPATVEIRDEIRYMRTQPLIVSQFGATVAGVVVGIEVTVHSQRYNRVSDWDIRLTHLGAKIGTNQKFKIELNDRDQPTTVPNVYTYGSSTSTWGAELTDTIVNDPTFGVSIELVSHPIQPHRDPAYIDSVSLRVFTQ